MGAARLVVAFGKWPLGMGVLRNEEPGRMEVASSAAQAVRRGVAMGDVVVEVNGCRLLLGLHHDAPKRVLNHVQLPLYLALWRAAPGKRHVGTVVQWRDRGKVVVVAPPDPTSPGGCPGSGTGGGGGPAGGSTAFRGAAAWVTLAAPRPRVGDGGTCVCAEVVFAHAHAPIKAGDLIVGLLGAPLAAISGHVSGGLTGEA